MVGDTALKIRLRVAAHIHSMTSTLREKDKGSGPHGGRYAAHNRGESDIYLHTSEPDNAANVDNQVQPDVYYKRDSAISEGRLPLHNQRANPHIYWKDQLDPTPGAGSTDLISASEALAIAVMQFNNFTNGRPHDNVINQDDIVQEALTNLLFQHAKNNTGYTPGLVTAAVHTATIRTFNAAHNLRHEDKAGLRKFDSEVEKSEVALNRHLTAAELDDIARHVRENWTNDRHRPRLGFHLPKQKTLSLTDESIYSEASDIEAPPIAPTKTTAADALVYQLESGELDRRAAAKQIWNALAGTTGRAPGAVPNTVTANAVKIAHHAIPNIKTVAANYLAGTATNEQTKALFTPWRVDLPEGQRRAAAALLVGHSEKVAIGLWKSAAATASQHS